ncbi:MAG: hypothetical protein KJ970_02435 [Candidatus Eisenbacteria bacterium]|uniref:Uncharacterized protein n=1 Tax=Eiseniibacteriota bacterium TaxID=2212470 RepID=A0A948W5N1_UNCEI|nr:hypothetical protein [Candidatus Eisenbacteria bacterium]MBU1949097.1 hypothetical protein [Candidatus Eisenbacteria bacterium]MBU2689756.1 hypothetical protein [Candidatus Eisenbacteria bacterium]
MSPSRRFLVSSLLVFVSLALLPSSPAAQVLTVEVRGSLIFCEYDMQEKRSGWLGCSTVLESGTEYDLPAHRVRGRGRKTFVVPFGIARSSVEYVCALWSEKVRDKNNKMGYHLEDRLATYRDFFPTIHVLTCRELEGALHLFLDGVRAFSFERKVRDSSADQEELKDRALATAEEILGLVISLKGVMPGTSAFPPIHHWIGRDESSDREYNLFFQLHWEDQVLVGLEAGGTITRLIGHDLRKMGFGGKRQYIYKF